MVRKESAIASEGRSNKIEIDGVGIHLEAADEKPGSASPVAPWVDLFLLLL